MERDHIGEYTYLRDISNEGSIPLSVMVFYIVMKVLNGMQNVQLNSVHFHGDSGYEDFCNNFPEIVPYLLEDKPEVE